MYLQDESYLVPKGVIPLSFMDSITQNEGMHLSEGKVMQPASALQSLQSPLLYQRRGGMVRLEPTNLATYAFSTLLLNPWRGATAHFSQCVAAADPQVYEYSFSINMGLGGEREFEFLCESEQERYCLVLSCLISLQTSEIKMNDSCTMHAVFVGLESRSVECFLV
jgi:hypothetical protein